MRRRGTWLALLVCAAVCATPSACAPADDAPATDAASTTPGTIAANPVAAAPVPEATPAGKASPEQLAGTWWCLTPDRPHRALRATLVPTDDDERWGGSWVSFDWRGSVTGDDLHRVSKPVEIQAELDGKQLTLRGPAPQIDAASGQPLGVTGRLELRLKLASLPGEPVRFAGRLLRDDEDDASEGLAVDMTPRFVPFGG